MHRVSQKHSSCRCPMSLFCFIPSQSQRLTNQLIGHLDQMNLDICNQFWRVSHLKDLVLLLEWEDAQSSCSRSLSDRLPANQGLLIGAGSRGSPHEIVTNLFHLSKSSPTQSEQHKVVSRDGPQHMEQQDGPSWHGKTSEWPVTKLFPEFSNQKPSFMRRLNFVPNRVTQILYDLPSSCNLASCLLHLPPVHLLHLT